MLQKQPKPLFWKTIRRGAALVFVAEALAFAGSYAIWYRMNTSRDFRLYMHKNHNWALDKYYTIGEKISSDSAQVRDSDLKTWKQEGKI